MLTFCGTPIFSDSKWIITSDSIIFTDGFSLNFPPFKTKIEVNLPPSWIHLKLYEVSFELVTIAFGFE